MEILAVKSVQRQPRKMVGPTVTLVYTDVRTETVEKDGVMVTLFAYTLYRFQAGEYELVQAGFLPSGAVWDDVLRSIERATLYREADDMIAKYSTDVPDDAKRTEWVGYKAGVRATQSAAGYPLTVEYPARPA